MSQHPGTAPGRSANDLDRQARWEMAGIEIGRAIIRREQQQAVEHGRVADMSQTSIYTREILQPLIARIEVDRTAAKACIGKRGRVADYYNHILVLEADVMALVTLSAAIRATSGSLTNTDAATTPAISTYISATLRDQVEVVAWRQRQASSGAVPADETWTAFQRFYPNADRRTWAAWRKRVRAVREEAWSRNTKLQLGAWLLSLLIEVAPDRFVIIREFRGGGGASTILGLTEAAKLEVLDIQLRQELARPRLMPMVIPPLPWRYEA